MIIVYYMDVETSRHLQYVDAQFVQALEMVQSLRRAGMKHVIMSNEPGDMVGRLGVDSVEDGKTPDGHDYEWSKKHRGGPPR